MHSLFCLRIDYFSFPRAFTFVWLATGYLLVFGLHPWCIHAQTLYGISIGANTLVTIDTKTGVASTVGRLGATDMEGLAYDSDGRRLLAVSYDNYLYSINRFTGET